MQRNIWFGIWMGIALLGGQLAYAEDYKPGDQVVVVVDGHLTVSGSKVVDEVWPGLVLKVADVNGEWLWVSNGKPGYLQKDKVIPLNRAAIGRLTDMLAANPRSARLYYGRAIVWRSLGELDIALADYNEAIRLDPKAAAYIGGRGRIWHAKQEFDKAIADYNEALRLDPKDVSAHSNRGSAWRAKQEYEKAIADFNEALRLDPKNSWAAFSIGVTRFLMRDAKAPDQFQATIDLQGWSGDRAVYSVILGSQSALLLGNAERAKRFLDDSAGKLKADWPYPLVQLLRGELDEPGLMALATDNGKQTEARCYLGLQELIVNRPEAASAHFTWVRDHGNKTYIEYAVAVAELKRLAK